MRNLTLAFFMFLCVTLCSVERLRIVVAPFSCTMDYCGSTAESIADRLNTELAAMDRFDVIERARQVHVFREQAFGMSGAVDEVTAAQAGGGSSGHR